MVHQFYFQNITKLIWVFFLKNIAFLNNKIKASIDHTLITLNINKTTNHEKVWSNNVTKRIKGRIMTLITQAYPLKELPS